MMPATPRNTDERIVEAKRRSLWLGRKLMTLRGLWRMRRLESLSKSWLWAGNSYALCWPASLPDSGTNQEANHGRRGARGTVRQSRQSGRQRLYAVARREADRARL